jgi:hypothetical protein
MTNIGAEGESRVRQQFLSADFSNLSRHRRRECETGSRPGKLSVIFHSARTLNFSFIQIWTLILRFTMSSIKYVIGFAHAIKTILNDTKAKRGFKLEKGSSCGVSGKPQGIRTSRTS